MTDQNQPGPSHGPVEYTRIEGAYISEPFPNDNPLFNQTAHTALQTQAMKVIQGRLGLHPQSGQELAGEAVPAANVEKGEFIHLKDVPDVSPQQLFLRIEPPANSGLAPHLVSREDDSRVVSERYAMSIGSNARVMEVIDDTDPFEYSILVPVDFQISFQE